MVTPSSDSLEKVKRRLVRLKERTYRRAAPSVYGAMYAYVLGWTERGKRVFWGPFRAETPELSREADRVACELADYEVFFKETRDQARAWREVKSDLMARGEDPDEVLRRALHKKDVR